MGFLSNGLVRESNRDDIPTLVALAERTYRETFTERDTPEEMERVVRETRSVSFFENALRNHCSLLALVDGIPVGYVLFGPVDQPGVVSEESDRELVHLYVLREHQGKGVGRALMDAALAHPSMLQAPHIYLNVWSENDRAKALYRRYGFVEAGIVNDDHFVMVRNAPSHRDTCNT